MDELLKSTSIDDLMFWSACNFQESKPGEKRGEVEYFLSDESATAIAETLNLAGAGSITSDDVMRVYERRL